MKVLGVCVLAVIFSYSFCSEESSEINTEIDTVIDINEDDTNRTETSGIAKSRTRRSRLFNLPFFGIGYYCNGCPDHFCDDDEAVIYGYCCGCASFWDVLPIRCSRSIVCPPNGYSLCEDYGYMMHCCC